MKRSVVNGLIREALEFFEERGFHLPLWARWSPEEWADKGLEWDGVRADQLGWDLTDFGSGDFFSMGLLLFTLRNGGGDGPPPRRPYAEKIMLVREEQITPFHFHWHKMEDIINRGGGDLVLRLRHGDDESSGEKIVVSIDGIFRDFLPDECVRLRPGESICLEPGIYHTFWSENGMTMVGEVSMVNDDATDNRFLDERVRFPAIEEDEPAEFFLCSEYPAREVR